MDTVLLECVRHALDESACDYYHVYDEVLEGLLYPARSFVVSEDNRLYHVVDDEYGNKTVHDHQTLPEYLGKQCG